VSYNHNRHITSVAPHSIHLRWYWWSR